MNLLDKLTDLDRKRIENYIDLYGVNKKDFIGIDDYLVHWAKEKKHLCKLLGGDLMVKIPYSLEKNADIIKGEFRTLATHTFIYKYIDAIESLKVQGVIDGETEIALKSLCKISHLIEDKSIKIKFKKEDCKKTLQIQPDMKPIRALGKVIDYFQLNRLSFEKFRIQHSMILNDRVIKGNLVLSIHPLDYLTMSDNASNWTSCMSWMGDGCYHIGTVEMMNSNNVVCCYVEGNTDFYFGEKDNEETKEKSEFYWNNKKWRQLFYVTKDIMVNGKSYPFERKELSINILKELQKLSKANLNHSYQFGPERYKDMIHINNNNAMDRNRKWIRSKTAIKKNIIFDTKGMYNDMINDNSFEYWCVRNPIKHAKMISYSGKSSCLCCKREVIKESDYPEDYNDRYNRVGDTVCYNCYEEGECYNCNKFKGKKSLTYVTIDGYTRGYCSDCFKDFIKVCPCCGETFALGHWSNNNELLWIRLTDKELTYSELHTYELSDIRDAKKNYSLEDVNAHPIYMCENCTNELKQSDDFEQIELETKDKHGFYYFRYRVKTYTVTKEVFARDENPYTKYYSYNLSNPVIEEED